MTRIARMKNKNSLVSLVTFVDSHSVVFSLYHLWIKKRAARVARPSSASALRALDGQPQRLAVELVVVRHITGGVGGGLKPGSQRLGLDLAGELLDGLRQLPAGAVA